MRISDWSSDVCSSDLALMRGIEVVRPGVTFGDLGHAIQVLVEEQRFSVVRDFCGHGLGRVFHAPPSVMHFGRPGEGSVIQEGMLFTIAPMVNAGRWEVKVLARSEERRVGKECVSTCRSRWSTYH